MTRSAADSSTSHVICASGNLARSDQSDGSVWMTSPIALVLMIRMFTGRVRLLAGERAAAASSIEAAGAEKRLHLLVERADLVAGNQLLPILSQRVLPERFKSKRRIDHLVHSGLVDAFGHARRQVDPVFPDHLLEFADVLPIVLVQLIEDDAIPHAMPHAEHVRQSV